MPNTRRMMMAAAGAVSEDGNPAYFWGWSDKGHLGDNANTSRSSPVLVSGDHNWTWIALGGVTGHSSGITGNGLLFTWGSGGYGALGGGSLTSVSVPTQVGALTNWYRSWAGANKSSMAIKTDGTLWGWGKNTNFVLGKGNTTSYSSPVQVGSDTNWESLGMGEHHSAGITTDGKLWTWGANTSGCLGRTDDIADHNVPGQVGSATNWRNIDCGQHKCMATRDDNTLWVWGENNNGDLGIGNTTDQAAPVQMGSLTNWRQASSGNFHAVATKTDGTLWSWGYGGEGHLGHGATKTHLSSPVQVGSLTDWLHVEVSWRNAWAIKTDGTLWAFGANLNGALGDGTTTFRSSPVQIGSDTDWLQIMAGKGDIHSAGGIRGTA